jgi:dienelactone hydrolase
MKKLISIFSLFLCFQLSAQTTGSFTEDTIVNATVHELEYYVPTSYNSANSYPLIVAIHGCGGNPTDYRDSFISFADSVGAILVCPDNFGDQLQSWQANVLTAAIHKTVDLTYNIDTTSVYLTGFSCNGQETMKQGWNDVYAFRGLIPLNPWVPDLTGYNYADADVPTCICSGTDDPSYDNSEDIYDNLIAASKDAKFVSMDGIGHVSTFAGRDSEMMKCINWIDSLTNPNIGLEDYTVQEDLIVQSHLVTNNLIIESNQEQVNVSLITIDGKFVKSYSLKNGINEINVSALTSGVYFIKYTIDGRTKAQKIVLSTH